LDNASLRFPAKHLLEITATRPISILGRGEIVLDGPYRDTLIQTYTGSSLTIGEGVTIRTGSGGGGTISRSDLPVINYGTIAATSPGQTLVVDGGLKNYGTLRAFPNAKLQVQSEDWINEGTIEVGGRSFFGGFVITSSSFQNAAAGLITGEGYLEMTTTSLVNSGVISPGSGVGKLEILGDVQLTDTSVLNIDLLTPQTFDQLSIVGDIRLNGVLQIDVSNPLSFRPGDSLIVVTTNPGSTLSGTFANKEGQVEYEDMLFDLSYTTTTVTLTVVEVPEPHAFTLFVLTFLGYTFCRLRRPLL
jgi:hypothetical protein